MQYLSLRDRIYRSCKPSFDFGFLELFSARTSNDEVREKKNDTGEIAMPNGNISFTRVIWREDG